MLHGREKSGPNILDLKQLYHNDRTMICWICDIKDRIETSSVLLLQELVSRQLRWYGHLQRARSCIKSVTDLPLPIRTGKGRPRKTWSECVKTDPQDRCLESQCLCVAWCCQPHWMGLGQHFNLKMDVMNDSQAATSYSHEPKLLWHPILVTPRGVLGLLQKLQLKWCIQTGLPLCQQQEAHILWLSKDAHKCTYFTNFTCPQASLLSAKTLLIAKRKHTWIINQYSLGQTCGERSDSEQYSEYFSYRYIAREVQTGFEHTYTTPYKDKNIGIL